MWKKILISIALIFVATLVYAAQRTVLGLNWTVVDGKLQARLDVVIPSNLEILGITYTDQIKPCYGTDEVKINNLKVDNIKIDNVIGDLISADMVQINDNICLKNLAGSGNRTVKIDNNGDLYAE
jgi:hypothetical protein